MEHRLCQRSERGGPLETLAATVDVEIFCAEVAAALGARDRAKGGQLAFDAVLKFRMLVLQARHGLSLAQTECLVADWLSWMRFWGLGPGDTVPDANTLWDFREALILAGVLDALFARLDRAITEAGYLPMAGQIVDATLVPAPRQRNTQSEKARIKADEKAAEIWPDKPAKGRQKATDARGTVKFIKTKPAADGKPLGDTAIPAVGYERHLSIDRRHGIIRRAKGTDAAAHDGADRPEQHGLRRLGRQRLSLGRERAGPRRHRQPQPHPPPQAARQADVDTHRAPMRRSPQCAAMSNIPSPTRRDRCAW